MRSEKQVKTKVIPLHTIDIVPQLAITLEEAHSRMKQLQQFVDEILIEGQDYGRIDGFSKPTLLKPGAEKLCDVFGFSKAVTVTNRIENWDRGIFSYEVKVTLSQKESGVVEAEGLGSCNSKESAFQQQDPYTIVNTVLKMAKKRALIDSVLSATRASGLFTQDIEDFPKKTAFKGGEELATKAQLHKIFQIVAEINMDVEVAKEMMKVKFNVDHSTKLSKRQASEFIDGLLHLKGCFKEVNSSELQ